MDDRKQKPTSDNFWYKNKGTVIALLVLFFPVGLYGMWKSNGFSRKTKWIVSGFFGLLVLASSGSNKKQDNNPLHDVSNEPNTPLHQVSNESNAPLHQVNTPVKVIKQGNKFKQYKTGQDLILITGELTRDGVISRKIDYNKAVLWWKKAADQGYAPAQFSLGAAYKVGLGVKKDIHKAMMWWKKAAINGFAPAQFYLGAAHSSGENGVPVNYSETIYWWRSAASQGEMRSIYALSRLRESAYKIK